MKQIPVFNNIKKRHEILCPTLSLKPEKRDKQLKEAGLKLLPTPDFALPRCVKEKK